MQIRRIQVEEGFLGGLDLHFREGLNVIIGARGTGKTSIIELLRFALGAKNHTTESATESLTHARSILEGGEVSVTLQQGEDDVMVSRTASEPKSRQTASFRPPIAFSQKEIESIGLTDAGRLSLLDGFVSERIEYKHREDRIISSLRSVQRDIETRIGEIDGLSDGLTGVSDLKLKLSEAKQRQQAQQGDSAEIALKQAELTKLAADQAARSVAEAAQARFVTLIDRWIGALRLALESGQPDQWTSDGPDPIGEFRPAFGEITAGATKALNDLEALRPRVLAATTNAVAAKVQLEARSRALRTELNSLAEGAGALAREIGALQGRITELEAIQNVVQDRRVQVAELRQRRDDLLSELDRARQERFASREAVAAKINAELNPRIMVQVNRYAHYNDYMRAIVEALRGSNLKYNELSQLIAEALSPRELIGMVESGDFDGLALAIGIPKERAARAAGVLLDAGLGDIAACDIEDDVKFSLLDGAEYKDIAHLSAGQRCTVILPIVLQHDDRVLIIDQPEDHIDNAFIADTLIKALRARAVDSQLIISTHNANIPVLGGASLVIEMVSDGRQGTVQVAEALEHPSAVHAITTVMEGGERAFQNRAQFYKDHHL